MYLRVDHLLKVDFNLDEILFETLPFIHHILARILNFFNVILLFFYANGLLCRVVQLLIHAMLIRYIYIRSSNQIRSNTEIQSSNIFESDIRPSLEGHGIFEYFLGIFENIWYINSRFQ